MAFDNPFAGEIWASKYRFTPHHGGGDANVVDTWSRVAHAVAQAEPPKLRTPPRRSPRPWAGWW